MNTPDEEKFMLNNPVTVVPGTAHLFISPLGFHHYASEFLLTARATKRQESFSPVPYYLYCHSIELSLKAFLLCKGVSKRELKKKLIHNLDKIFVRACALGIKAMVNLSTNHEACISKANKYYQAKGFEYFDVKQAGTGYQNRPDLNDLDCLAELLLNQLKQCCVEAVDNPPTPITP